MAPRGKKQPKNYQTEYMQPWGKTHIHKKRMTPRGEDTLSQLSKIYE